MLMIVFVGLYVLNFVYVQCFEQGVLLCKLLCGKVLQFDCVVDMMVCFVVFFDFEQCCCDGYMMFEEWYLLCQYIEDVVCELYKC